MTTVPLGENPYLYQGGATVPLRQQKTGAYAANSFGNRVFYTPEDRLPNSTLAPGLAPTPGAIARQNLTGAGLAAGAIGGALQAQAVYSQGGGLFEGLGVGVGTIAGGIGGQVAGAAAGAAVGGAVGSAVPVVGTVVGAGAGTVIGAVGGGLAGGAVGGSVGGGIGRAIDDFFWPDPAKPDIGIPTQPGAAQPIRNLEDYPGQFAALAAEAGAIVMPGTPPPFKGGQSPVAYRVSWTRSYGTPNQTVDIMGPLRLSRALQGSDSSTGCGEGVSFNRYTMIGSNRSENLASGCGETATNIRVERVDGLADTGGDPSGGIDPIRAPNAARVPSRPLRTPYYPAGSGTPSAPPVDLPWPEFTPAPIADTVPFGDSSPFKEPADTPEFTPTPDPLKPLEPEATPTPTTPQAPLDPLNPTGPSKPLEPEKKESGRGFPGFIPSVIPVKPINPPDFKDPEIPVTIRGGSKQPAITPTGSPNQLINPTDAPTTNPNTKAEITPVEQPARIEEGKCCIPPANPDIIKRLEQIKSGIGVDGLPASVPDQIAKQNPTQLQIGSLAELHLWQVQQLDGVMGRWPQQIPIPTPAGPVNVGMPNMAEAVAEMVGMMVSQQVTAAQILNTSSRTLVQAGSATQQAHLANITSQANADFLGYESRANAVDMPLAYTPGADPFDGFLNESTAKVRGFQNTDKTDIKAILAELLQAAAIIRAVYWRKLDTKGDLKKQIGENVRGQGDFIDKAAAGDGNDSDWEAYLKQVAEGFRGATGDATPYNRPPGEGPQIKDRSPKKDGK
ncbi:MULTISPECIES: hypothetical protein [Cyanophyceae]|uniref:hypothetical protein n=1 Tax=Cyanophyceae TaxID=3028117 RepID=UPI001686646C|nr:MULTISPECIES: hypothetical protein [Cyanophyceae]MBD1917164.1 hypothetical protein [Phormidium sp. FACHB-77]MBD2030695.1 hypothetical protein [Phormidium sp. FACHB-322]MBD2050197.1 hypothetical protein [Leptolyngbya sp. FACHB-60]